MSLENQDRSHEVPAAALSLREIETKLQAEVPEKEKHEIETFVTKDAILGIRTWSLNSISLETGSLETNSKSLNAWVELSARQKERDPDDVLGAYNDLEIAKNARRVQESIAVIKLHMAEYGVAEKMSGDSGESEERIASAFKQITDYIKRLEEKLESQEIRSAITSVLENTGGVERFSDLPSYSEISRPLPKPKSVVEGEIERATEDMNLYLKKASSDPAEGPPSELATRLFNTLAYRCLIRIKTLERIKEEVNK